MHGLPWRLMWEACLDGVLHDGGVVQYNEGYRDAIRGGACIMG